MKLQSMMKILLIFTLSLISGPVSCYDITGYSGGSIIIISNVKWDSNHSKYIHKVGKINTNIIHINSKEDHTIVERFMLYSNPKGNMTVFISKLKPQDAGTYRMGAENGKSTDVNLTVIIDSCSAGPKITNAYRGQNINIICNYPAEYERKYKLINKLHSNSVIKDILNTETKSQNGRFSVFDHRHAKVLSVNISDVRESDDGVYLCGVFNGEGSVLYYSFFTEIQLYVREPTTAIMTSAAPTGILADAMCFSSSSIIIIIICVCVCIALLFAGFALMIYKLRHRKTHDLTASSTDNVQAPPVYENDLANLPSYENVSNAMRLNHQNLCSFTSQSDSAYVTLDPLTNQSDSGYMTLTNTTVQSHLHYQSLNPRTRTNSVYYTLHS